MPTLISTTKEFEVLPQSTSIPPFPTPSLDGTSNSSQNVTANPSLILAFLALSIFTMAMVFIFGFRKHQHLQEHLYEAFGRQGDSGSNQNRQSQQAATLEEEIRLRRLPKPKLWDVPPPNIGILTEVKGEGGKVADLWSWGNIMPLSASKEVANTDGLGIVVPFHLVPRTHRNWKDFQRFWPFARSLRDKNSTGPKIIGPLPTRPTFRVAVLVALPSEHYPMYETRGLRDGGLWHERGIFGYELGLYDLAWDKQ